MDEFIVNITFPSFLCGIIFMVAGGFMCLFPPKKINYLYGYRTGNSMQSQERWDFAQKFSAALMVKSAIVMVVLSALSYFIPVEAEPKMIAGIAMVLVCALYLFINTERAIKNQFKN